MSGFVSSKALTVAVGALALAMVAIAPANAEKGRNGAAALGVLGGLAVGAIAAGALAGPPANAAPVVVRPARPPVTIYEEVEPECHVEIRREYVEGFGYRRVRSTICE